MVRKNAELSEGKQVKMGGNLFDFRRQTCNGATPPKTVRKNTGHFAQKTFRTSLLAQVLDRSHNS